MEVMKEETPPSTAVIDKVRSELFYAIPSSMYKAEALNDCVKIFKKYASQFTTTPTSGQEGRVKWIKADKHNPPERKKLSLKVDGMPFAGEFHVGVTEPYYLLENGLYIYKSRFHVVEWLEELEGGQEVSRGEAVDIVEETLRESHFVTTYTTGFADYRKAAVEVVKALAASTPTNKGQEREYKTVPQKIKCPECESIEDAIVELSYPWATYVHTCKKCGYLISESEWDVVEGQEKEREVKP